MTVLHAIILNWRTPDMTLRSAEALVAAMAGIDGAITIVDNDSGDGSEDAIARGIADECGLVGASVVGGDLTRADQIVVSVTVLGRCTQSPVLRSGARSGDVLALTGRQGWAAAGLAVLGRGFRSPRVLVEAYQRPEPPYAQGRFAAEAGATAMIDISDGLLAEAGHIAAASGVAIDVRRDAFEVPEPLVAVAAAIGGDPMQFVLGGGDDHALLATFPDVASVPDGWQVIGAVTEGEGVTVDGGAYDGPTGWAHF